MSNFEVTMPVILIVGATRGLGASLVELYASEATNRVIATARTSSPPADSECDVTEPGAS